MADSEELGSRFGGPHSVVFHESAISIHCAEYSEGLLDIARSVGSEKPVVTLLSC